MADTGRESPRTSRYQKRPVVVEAIRFAKDKSNWIECCRFVGDDDDYDETDEAPDFLDVPTLHGVAEAVPGDWIIKGPQGDFWPCKPKIFKDSYAEVTG